MSVDIFTKFKSLLNITLLCLFSILSLFNYSLAQASIYINHEPEEAIFSISNDPDPDLGVSDPVEEEVLQPIEQAARTANVSSPSLDDCLESCPTNATIIFEEYLERCSSNEYLRVNSDKYEGSSYPSKRQSCEDTALAERHEFKAACERTCRESDSAAQSYQQQTSQATPSATTVSNQSDASDSRIVPVVNPLGINDVRVFIGRIITAIIGISGLIFLIMFVYAGILYLTSSGQEGMLKRAKSIMTYSVIGILIIAGAYVIVNTVFTAVTSGGVIPSSESSD